MNNKVLYNEAQAEKSFLTLINAAVSHELRNPLNSLINQAMFLKNYIQTFKKFVISQGQGEEEEQDANTKKIIS